MRKQEQQEIKQSVILVGIGFQINKIRKIQYPVKEILEEEIIRFAAEPRLNNKPFVSATDKPHDIAGTIRVIYQSDRDRIEKRLHELHIPFSRMDFSESIRRWNNGEFPVALIHPASAGHGLNLHSGGSTIVWFGMTWSLELYSQTNARLWRQGQTADTVVVMHIITAGTIDEDILKALQRKDKTQSALIAAVKANL